MTPTSEQQRQVELDALRLEFCDETAFDDLVRLAANTFDVPISTISIIDRDRQWFKAAVGVDVRMTAPRELTFCDHTVRNPGETLVVEDATKDARFASNPFVNGEPGLRFYAAAPLTLSSGVAIGTICVMDTHPHHVDPGKLEQLRFMAKQVVATLEARKARL